MTHNSLIKMFAPCWRIMVHFIDFHVLTHFSKTDEPKGTTLTLLKLGYLCFFNSHIPAKT